MIKDYLSACLSLRPGKRFEIINNDISTIIYHGDDEPPSVEEIEAECIRLYGDEEKASLRKERDRRLSETDWWASSDRTMTEAQTAYRQALRDITQHYQSLDEVVWPEKP